MVETNSRLKAWLLLFLLLLTACGPPAAVPTVPPPTPDAAATLPPSPTPVPAAGATSPAGLTADQAATLESLQLVDDYPLYTMRYVGAYDQLPPAPVGMAGPAATPWACSLFAALGDPQGMLYGRNFDWDYSPALLLFTAPPDGYASVSMVDIAYLGFVGGPAGRILDLPLEERTPLLYAPLIPFDGMNEAGLAVGMAAVPDSAIPYDPNRATLDSVRMIREMLDHAATVDEAVAILGRYNVDWGSGPPLHYLIADGTGRAVLAEFYQGEVVTFPNESPWHLATNFLRAAAGESPAGQCWRYDRLAARLAETRGQLTVPAAMELLKDVSQEGTQWSVVYSLDTGVVAVSMERAYETVHTWDILESRR